VAEIRLATPADGAQLSAIYAPLVRDTAISFEWERVIQPRPSSP
jgi:hypothetical protein